MGGEIALFIFSLCLQGAIGTMLFITLGKQLYKDKTFKTATITAAVLSVVGVLASLVHLGQPLLALNSLFRLGNSWLSNEVFSSGVFMGVAVLYALAIYFKPANLGLHTGLRYAGSVVGLVAVFSMAKVYTFTSVAVWQGVNTFVDFYSTAVVLGILVLLVTGFKELKLVDKKVFGFIVLAAVIIQASVAIPYAIGLGLNGQAAQASAQILSGLGFAIGIKWFLLLGGAGSLLWLVSQKSDESSKGFTVGSLYALGAVLVVGQLIGRYIFYAAFIASTIGLT